MCHKATRRYPTLLKIGKFLAPSISYTDTAYFYLSPFAVPRRMIVVGRDVQLVSRWVESLERRTIW
jgi:hypothetical protein